MSYVDTAVSSMENVSSPGIDGLSVRFYKAFWLVLKQDLVLSNHREVLSLLPKKGDINDWRIWLKSSQEH